MLGTETRRGRAVPQMLSPSLVGGKTVGLVRTVAAYALGVWTSA